MSDRNIVRLGRPNARRAKVPLCIWDTWIVFGPEREVVIMALAPRPTARKSDAQAAALTDGRTLAEATLRGSYMREREYREVFQRALGRKLRAAFTPPAEVIQLRLVTTPRAP
jgi:hypothetical protein